jgi:hypothetical protein
MASGFGRLVFYERKSGVIVSIQPPQAIIAVGYGGIDTENLGEGA